MNKNAVQIYDMFQALGDAEHIATPVNIAKIIDLCKKEQPLRILEMGGGVGALSYAMLSNSLAFVDIYEDNEFCRGKLHQNLKEFEGRYSIIPNYRTLPPERNYDLMIVDGGNKELYHPEWFFIRYLESIKTIYIEGFRRSQYASISRALSAGHVFKTEKIKGEVIDGKFRKGGTLIRATPSGSRIKKMISYLYGRLTEDLLFDRTFKFFKRIAFGK